MHDSLTIQSGSKVPAEFLGRARAFRTSLLRPTEEAADALEAMKLQFAIRNPRRVLLEKLRQRWIALPPHGRLECIARFHGPALHLAELRVLACTVEDRRWVDGTDEPGVAVAHFEMVRTPTEFAWKAEVMAGVGAHAISRHFQRAFKAGEEALFQDLEALADAYHRTIRTGGEFAIETDNGALIGKVVVNKRKARWLNVRTFK